jgi:uncharacterized SAM-binding protein YcdF (DUF218 family)
MSFDATLIPGGGLTAAGQVTPWVAARLDQAIVTYQGEYLIPLSAGTPHKPPPLDARGFPILEAIAAAHYLVQRDIPADRIWPETCSLDTIGNAYFARAIHTDPSGLRRLRIITSAFHLPRTEAIFEWIFGLNPGPNPYQLHCIAVPDVGLSPDGLQARHQREQAGLARIHTLAETLPTLSDLHRWLYRDHQAYAVAHRPQPLTGSALESY